MYSLARQCGGYYSSPHFMDDKNNLDGLRNSPLVTQLVSLGDGFGTQVPGSDAQVLFLFLFLCTGS